MGVTAVGVVLTLPSLWAGLYLDDYVLWATASGASALRDLFPPSLDMFAFIDGDPGRTRQMMDRGILPWWTFEAARLAFWRPLTSLTHWLDFALWPDRPALMHLHNVVWFAALLVVLALTYRRLIGRTWVAGLAALGLASWSLLESFLPGPWARVRGGRRRYRGVSVRSRGISGR